MTKIAKKTSLLILAVFLMFKAGTPAARAWDLTDFGSGDIAEMAVAAMEAIFEELGVDQDELEYNIQSLNESRRKKEPPQVSVNFNPGNPAPGEKVTATAIPKYFMNDSKDMYFTWYLKTDDCDEPYRNLDRCDLNDDGRINIEDYKIKAARIIAGNDFEWENESYSSDSDSDGYNAIMGGNDQRNRNDHCFIYDFTSGDMFELSDGNGNGTCGHLFPEGNSGTVGDGSFGRNEEEFWRTNPNDPDTADTGNMDEANVAGLGVSSFTWNYEAGDEVGVAVEGISVDSTQYADSSFRIMWAFPKNNCEPIGTGGAAPDGMIDMDMDDVNDCLVRNFLSPSEGGGQAEKMEVSLSYLPEFPMNDPGGIDGDELVIHSSVLNAKNKGYLNYVWQVYEGDEANPDSWGDPLLKSQLPGSSQTSGLGIDTLKFKLNFANPSKYLRVKLAVSENVSSGTTREGHSDVVIPVSSIRNKIEVRNVSVSNDLNLGLGEEKCTQGLEKTVCPVAKNEIVGLKIESSSLSGFLWTVDGEPVTYKECFFSGCDEESQGNTAFFPVTKNAGEEYTVNLSAADQETGEKVNLTRVLKVVDPEIKIVSADENLCRPVLLGNYVDLDGNTWPDYSKQNFTALAGSSIRLKAMLGEPSNPISAFFWIVDGHVIHSSTAGSFGHSTGTDQDGNPEITLAPKADGEFYNVAASGLFTQSNNTKKALNRHWDIPYNAFWEERLGSSIQVEITDFMPATSAENSKSKTLASVSAGLPDYFIFLFRITVTAFLILTFSSIILSLFPQTKRDGI